MKKIIDSMQSLDSKVQFLSTLLKFIPSLNEVHGFFAPAARAITDIMKNTECLLSNEGKWIKPSQALILPILSGLEDLAFSHSWMKDVHQIHSKLFIEPRIKKALGVDLLSASQVLVTIKELQGDSTKNLPDLVYFFVCLLENESVAATKLLVQEFRSLPIFSVNRRKCALNGSNYFVSPEPRQQPDILRDSGAFSFLDLVPFVDLSTICRNLSIAKKLQDLLELKEGSPQRIFNDFILPGLQAKELQKSSAKVLVEVAIYLSQCIDLIPSNAFDDLRKLLPFVDGLENIGYIDDEPIHLPKSLGGILDQAEAPFWRTLSPAYTAWFDRSATYKGIRKDQMSKFTSFMAQLGVGQLLSVVPVISTEEDGTVFDYESPELPKIFTEYNLRFDDLRSNGSDEALNRYLSFVEQMFIFAGALASNWSSFELFTKKRNVTTMEESPSTFLITLQTNPWVPSTTGLLTRPSEMFMKNEMLSEILGESVEYSAIKSDSPSFAQVLEFKTKISADHLAAAMHSWNEDTTVIHQFHLYTIRFMYGSLLKETMLAHPSLAVPIFIPRELVYTPKSDDVIDGYFVKKQCCVLTDPHSISSGWAFSPLGGINDGIVVLNAIYKEFPELLSVLMIFYTFSVYSLGL